MTDYSSSSAFPAYAVSQDGQDFLVIQRGEAADDAKLILVQNFFEELKARVPN